MRLFKLVPVLALVAATVAAPSPSAAAPKDATKWWQGTPVALEVNADGTLRTLMLQLVGTADSQPLSPCGTMRMADHPQLLHAFDRSLQTKVKTVDGCVTIVTVFH
jgi:hypothetical protein